MPPRFTGQQLAFDAGPVPSFLQKLHADVNSGRAKLEDKRGGGRRGGEASEFDDLLGVGGSGNGSGSGRGHGGADDVGADQEDEEEDWAGAQVVVLKDGKHLSAEEVQAAKDDAREGQRASEVEKQQDTRPEAAIADAGIATASRKRRAVASSASPSPPPPPIKARLNKADDLGAAKDVIAAARAGHKGMVQKAEADAAETAEDKQRKKDEKRKQEREQKNKRARAEKKKMGKGLSFDLED